MMKDLGWWFIHGDEIMDALNKVYDGELPAIAYAELYANSEQNEIEVLDAEES